MDKCQILYSDFPLFFFLRESDSTRSNHVLESFICVFVCFFIADGRVAKLVDSLNRGKEESLIF